MPVVLWIYGAHCKKKEKLHEGIKVDEVIVVASSYCRHASVGMNFFFFFLTIKLSTMIRAFIFLTPHPLSHIHSIHLYYSFHLPLFLLHFTRFILKNFFVLTLVALWSQLVDNNTHSAQQEIYRMSAILSYQFNNTRENKSLRSSLNHH